MAGLRTKLALRRNVGPFARGPRWCQRCGSPIIFTRGIPRGRAWAVQLPEGWCFPCWGSVTAEVVRWRYDQIED